MTKHQNNYNFKFYAVVTTNNEKYVNKVFDLHTCTKVHNRQFFSTVAIRFISAILLALASNLSDS